MQTYIGYGFDTCDISKEGWKALIEKYDKEAFNDWARDNEIDPENVFVDESLALFIEESSMGAAEYLADIINGTEAEEAGTHDIVSVIDDFLIFESLRFAGDEKRAEHVKTKEDFVKMIGKYVPTEEITFGNLYEGADWIDPSYYLEA